MVSAIKRTYAPQSIVEPYIIEPVNIIGKMQPELLKVLKMISVNGLGFDLIKDSLRCGAFIRRSL